jgi:hypothetical protein
MMALDTITIHGNQWERPYIQDSAAEARQRNWSLSRCTFPAEHHRHCMVCWWELYESQDPARSQAYASGDYWLCGECHERFVARNELGLA